MKPLRILLIGALAFLLLAVIAVALAFTPGVQTWAARKFAPATPELTVTIGRVNAGLSQTRLQDVRVVQPGLVLTLPSAEVDVGVLGAIGGKVDIKRLVAKGWILDLSQPAPATAATSTPADNKSSNSASSANQAASDAFNGVFSLLELPVDLSVDGVDFSGEVILPEGRAQVALNGGGLSAGNEGRFNLTTNVKSGASQLALNGVAAAKLATPRTFESLSFVANARATGPDLPAGATLDFKVEALNHSGAETYVAGIRSGQRELFHLDAKLPAGASPLTGSWTLDAVTADATPFVLGSPLPDFVAKGQGTFQTDRAFKQVKSAGSLDATLDKLSTLQAEFAALGKLTLAAGFDVAVVGDVASLNKLDIRVSGARPVLTIAAAQAVNYNTATGDIAAANPATELARITLDGVPLAWAKPFLGDLNVTGGDIRGAFAATARDGGFSVRPVAPITLTNVSVSQGAEPLVKALDISLAAQADYTPKGWTATVTDLTARSAGAQLLKATLKASQDTARTDQPLKADGTYEASLPALLNQPVAAGSASLSRGVARGDFSASIAKLQAFSLTLQLAELATAGEKPVALPSIAIQARADIAADGRIDARAPILITHAGRRSDLNLTATVRPADKTTRIDAQLASDVLYLEDAVLFSGLSPAAPATPSAPSTTPPSKPAPAPAKPAPQPTEPVWAGVEGELKLALKRVIYSTDFEVTDVGGAVKITPAALTLDNIRAAIGKDGKFAATGGLTFDAKQTAEPYGLKADVVLANVDPEPLLRTPGKQAPVVGHFDITTTLSGRADNPGSFGEGVLGDVKLAGRNGTFRALDTKVSNAVSNASKGAALVGILGSALGSSSTVKLADQARAAADVATQLSAIQFDQLTLVLSRDADKNMEIKDLSLVSKFVQLAGSGKITHVPDVPLRQQPLLVNLQLGAKDKLAADLRTLNLLKAEGDESGFTQLVEALTLEGSLQSMGTKQLQSLINRVISH